MILERIFCGGGWGGMADSESQRILGGKLYTQLHWNLQKLRGNGGWVYLRIQWVIDYWLLIIGYLLVVIC